MIKIINILDRITQLRLERKWSEYELAKYSNITQSTISTWYRENQLPTIKSLDKICSGCGITLSQFFAENGDAISLTPKQREMLDNWSSLTEIQQELFLKLCVGLRLINTEKLKAPARKLNLPKLSIVFKLWLILRTLNWFQCQGQFFDSNRYKITTVTGEKSVSTAWPPY